MKLNWEVVPSGVSGTGYRVRRKHPHGQHNVIYDTQNSLSLEQAHAIACALNELDRPNKKEEF